MVERFAALVLWMLVEKWSLLFGLVASIGAYVALRPRERPGWSELRGEGWRLVAIAAAAPAFLLGAEAGLWAWLMGYRAPVAYTGLAGWLGVFLVVASLVPVAAAWAYRRGMAKGALAGLAIAVAGLGVIAAGRIARAAAWDALETSVTPGDEMVLDEVARLKVLRYLAREEAESALDRGLPTAGDALAMAERARAAAGREEGVGAGADGSEGGGLVLDGELRASLADRIETALVAGGPPVPIDAVPALWWLTGDEHRTLRAYALARPPLRSSAVDGEPRTRDVLRDALLVAEGEVELTILRASYGPLAREELGGPLVEVLAAHQSAPEPVGRLATLILLREASPESLRPVAPRFSDPEAPEWAYLREECPARMVGLDRLSVDPDPEVAAGAKALRRYVETNCVNWVQQG